MTAKVCYSLPRWPPGPQRPLPRTPPAPLPLLLPSYRPFSWATRILLPFLLGASRNTPLTSPPISCPVVKSSFVVPPCRGRRELVNVVDSGASFTVTRLSAYQVTDLVPGTKY